MTDRQQARAAVIREAAAIYWGAGGGDKVALNAALDRLIALVEAETMWAANRDTHEHHVELGLTCEAHLRLQAAQKAIQEASDG